MAELKDLKARIIDEIPLSSVVGHYINLTRRGSANMAVCPFHDDHNPSMSVSDERKRFKCFACGEGGNAIDFVVKYKNLDFLDALREICDRHAINFDDYFQKKKQNPKVEMAKRILGRVTTLYRKMATSKNHPAFAEFLKNRELPVQVAQTFQLGFAPKDGSVTRYLESIPSKEERQFALDVATQIHLIRANTPEQTKKHGQTHYDSFRDRIMFPIWDHYGQVIGFTSRAIHDYQKAKYMNSKESFLFNKSEILYGLHLAKKAIRERDAVIVVEGNMDQIALYAKGFENSVAIMGTAFGAFHLNILRGLTSHIYLAFDTDKAGMEGMKRASELCLRAGLVARYIDFGEHKDADDFLKAEGRLALQKLIDEAPNFIDKELEALIPESVPELLDQKLALLRQAFAIVAPLKEELAATERIHAFAARIGLMSQSESIMKHYRDFLNGDTHGAPFTQHQELGPPIDLEAEAESADASPSEQELRDILSEKEPLTQGEKLFLRQVVQNPELITHSKFPSVLDFIRSNEVKEYVWRLSDLAYEVDDSEYPQVVRALTAEQQVSKDVRTEIERGLTSYETSVLNDKVLERILVDMKRKLQEDKLRVEREELLTQRQICQTQEELNELLLKLSRLDKELSDLKLNKNMDTDPRPTQGSR